MFSPPMPSSNPLTAASNTTLASLDPTNTYILYERSSLPQDSSSSQRLTQQRVLRTVHLPDGRPVRILTVADTLSYYQALIQEITEHHKQELNTVRAQAAQSVQTSFAPESLTTDFDKTPLSQDAAATSQLSQQGVMRTVALADGRSLRVLPIANIFSYYQSHIQAIIERHKQELNTVRTQAAHSVQTSFDPVSLIADFDKTPLCQNAAITDQLSRQGVLRIISLPDSSCIRTLSVAATLSYYQAFVREIIERHSQELSTLKAQKQADNRSLQHQLTRTKNKIQSLEFHVNQLKNQISRPFASTDAQQLNHMVQKLEQENSNLKNKLNAASKKVGVMDQLKRENSALKEELVQAFTRQGTVDTLEREKLELEQRLEKAHQSAKQATLRANQESLKVKKIREQLKTSKSEFATLLTEHTNLAKQLSGHPPKTLPSGSDDTLRQQKLEEQETFLLMLRREVRRLKNEIADMQQKCSHLQQQNSALNKALKTQNAATAARPSKGAKRRHTE